MRHHRVVVRLLQLVVHPAKERVGGLDDLLDRDAAVPVLHELEEPLDVVVRCSFRATLERRVQLVVDP